jgi:hypothetical protein
VPQWVARVQQPDVVYIPLDELLTPYELIVAWNSNTDNPAVANFREISAGIAGQMLLQPPDR